MCSFCIFYIFCFKQKTAYEMRISDWSSDVCSSDLSQWFGQMRANPIDYFGKAARSSAQLHKCRELTVPLAGGDGQQAAALFGARCRSPGRLRSTPAQEIGRASWRERVCQYV